VVIGLITRVRLRQRGCAKSCLLFINAYLHTSYSQESAENLLAARPSELPYDYPSSVAAAIQTSAKYQMSL
jgi:hypothetical protein